MEVLLEVAVASVPLLPVADAFDPCGTAAGDALRPSEPIRDAGAELGAMEVVVAVVAVVAAAVHSEALAPRRCTYSDVLE